MLWDMVGGPNWTNQDGEWIEGLSLIEDSISLGRIFCIKCWEREYVHHTNTFDVKIIILQIGVGKQIAITN